MVMVFPAKDTSSAAAAGVAPIQASVAMPAMPMQELFIVCFLIVCCRSSARGLCPLGALRPALGRTRSHRLGLERPVAHLKIGLDALCGVNVEELLAIFIVRGLREGTVGALEKQRRMQPC